MELQMILSCYVGSEKKSHQGPLQGKCSKPELSPSPRSNWFLKDAEAVDGERMMSSKRQARTSNPGQKMPLLPHDGPLHEQELPGAEHQLTQVPMRWQLPLSWPLESPLAHGILRTQIWLPWGSTTLFVWLFLDSTSSSRIHCGEQAGLHLIVSLLPQLLMFGITVVGHYALLI